MRIQKIIDSTKLFWWKNSAPSLKSVFRFLIWGISMKILGVDLESATWKYFYSLYTVQKAPDTSFLIYFSPDDVQSIISGKLALRYSGSQVCSHAQLSTFFFFSFFVLIFSLKSRFNIAKQWHTSHIFLQLVAMKSIANASHNRSLSEFQQVW